MFFLLLTPALDILSKMHRAWHLKQQKSNRSPIALFCGNDFLS